MFLMIVVLFAVSGAARQLGGGGDVWAPSGEVVSGDGVAAQLLRQMKHSIEGVIREIKELKLRAGVERDGKKSSSELVVRKIEVDHVLEVA
ncbi:hypothetical protein ZWY2020_049454 [Hordeum vulgare]|nr:hypothetical protein ZWY2020_049454 [Hordeum vulgare]